MIVFQKNGNKFEQFLHYNDTVTTLFPVDYYNGNVKRIDWRHGTQGDMNCYEFEYNNLDRLVVARFVARDTVTGEPKTYPDGTPDYSAAFGYDLNANITSLLRMGLTRHLHEGNSQERVYDRIDDVVFTLDGNRFNRLDLYDFGARPYDPTRGAFLTGDPLAEDDPATGPTAFCAANPVRFTDPTGMFSFENMYFNNQNYPVVAVFPSTRDKALENDYQAALAQSVPIIVVDDVTDFINAEKSMMYDLQSTATSYVINSHGNHGSFAIGNEQITTETDMTSLKYPFSGKTVFISACLTGASDMGIYLTEGLAEQAQTTAITSMHLIKAGYKYDGSEGLDYPNAGVDGYRYRISKNGEAAGIIYNLSISKRDGITWHDYDKIITHFIQNTFNIHFNENN